MLYGRGGFGNRVKFPDASSDSEQDDHFDIPPAPKSKPRRSRAFSGRGGYGNIIDTSLEEEYIQAEAEQPSPLLGPTRTYSVGRGGAGNVIAPTTSHTSSTSTISSISSWLCWPNKSRDSRSS